VEIHVLGPGDADKVIAAGYLFDDAPKVDAVERFLAERNHHLLVAYEDGVPAGFVSGMRRLAGIARSNDCYGIWVLTDESNLAAMATYRSAGATEKKETVLFSWPFRTENQPFE